jgi:DNA helicase-2/ATP-dependent DNA helicase PcrA
MVHWTSLLFASNVLGLPGKTQRRTQNTLDYDDLLLYWAQMVSDPGMAGEIGGRFDHILVDEYQDTNRLQASILLALKPTGYGLTVVGDDAQ